MRKDLSLTPGQAAAQAGHAFLDSFDTATHDEQVAYRCDGGTKVVLSVDDEPSLVEILMRAKKARLPCSLIIEDDFDPPTATAVGIGPVLRSEAKKIVGKLPLME